jgi:hypothetical protein
VNLVRPDYHVGWLASRLGLRVEEPLEPIAAELGVGPSARDANAPAGGLRGVLRQGRRRTIVELRPEPSPLPRGTTLRVELEAVRRNKVLHVFVTAEAATVTVGATLDGDLLRPRTFMAPRRTEVDMLAEVIEAVGHNQVAVGAMRSAAALIAPGSPGSVGG